MPDVEKKIEKLPVMHRVVDLARVSTRQEGTKRVLMFSASSEEPVERWFGTEVLSHKNGAVRLDRVKGGAMPLLFNHDPGDPVGMVTSAKLEDRRLVVEAEMFATARAQDVWDMVEQGLRNVSIGYRTHVIEENIKEQMFTATDWEPYETSIVTVPADPSVGVGRDAKQYEVRMVRAKQPGQPGANGPADNAEGGMMDQTKSTAPAAENAGTAGGDVPAEMRSNVQSKPGANPAQGGDQSRQISGMDSQPPHRSGLDMERERIDCIRNLCEMAKLGDNYVQHYRATGMTLKEVSDDILAIQEERSRKNPQTKAKLGLTEQETQRFSLARAIKSVADKDWKDAAFELDVCKSTAQRLGRAMDPTKILIPYDVLERDMQGQDRVEVMARLQRDLTAGTTSAGGFLVATDNMGFIELLRNRMVAFRMGARRMSGLSGNVTIPRLSASATGYWLGTEGTQATESQQTFQQVSMTPKTVGGYTEISRQLLLQSSPGAEGIVTDDLARVVSVAGDLGALEGSGSSGQPTGISQTSGIGAVTGTSLAYADVLEFQSDVGAANIMPVRGGYVTPIAIAALLAARMKVTNDYSPLWEGNLWDGSMAGFPAMSSEQLTAASMIFGDWQELVIGEWGVLEVEVNPFANFQAGIIGVRAMYSMDVGVRRPAGFSRSTSIT